MTSLGTWDLAQERRHDDLLMNADVDHAAAPPPRHLWCSRLRVRDRAIALLVLVVLILAACSSGHPTGLRVPPLPAGWKTVSYSGIGIDVPRTWTVRQWFPHCFLPSPMVLVGPERFVQMRCPPSHRPGAEVVLGSLFRFSGGSGKNQTINGIRARVETETTHKDGQLAGVGGDITYLSVDLPDRGFAVSVAVGESTAFPGGAPGRAEQIVQTIHATTRTTATACAASPGSPPITLSDQAPSPTLTVPAGAKVVVNIPRAKAGGEATDITIGDSDVLEEVCTVLLPNHGRRTVVLAIGPGRSSMEATTSGLTSGVFIPAWSGTIRVTS